MFPFLDDFAHGALTTIQLTVYSALLGFAVAVVAGIAMLSKFRVLRFVARTYTEVFRGASELVVLYVFVFGLSEWFGLKLPILLSAVIALALNIGGYYAEVVRGAVQAVPRGQTEAAIALNMPPMMRLRRIIVPQAVVAMLPPLRVLTVQLLKASALVSIIGMSDLTTAGKDAINLNLQYTRYFGETLIAYYIIATALNWLFGIGEWRARRGRDIGGKRPSNADVRSWLAARRLLPSLGHGNRGPFG